MNDFQPKVEAWIKDCFGSLASQNPRDRGDRFIEEALELAQSNGYTRERVEELLDYVYSRPAGEPSQEVGGVMVTLAGYCSVIGVNMQEAAETELARVSTPEIIEKIRTKEANKPKGSARPGTP